MSESRNGTPLEGVRVVEMNSLLAGAFCGQLLADSGVEVQSKVRYNDAVYEKTLGLAGRERDGLRGRGII